MNKYIRRIVNKGIRTNSSLKVASRIWYYNCILRNKQKQHLTLKVQNMKSQDELWQKISQNNRTVNFLREDAAQKQLVVTCYFTKKPDPQSGQVRSSSDFSFIKPWHESLTQILGKYHPINPGHAFVRPGSDFRPYPPLPKPALR